MSEAEDRNGLLALFHALCSIGKLSPGDTSNVQPFVKYGPEGFRRNVTPLQKKGRNRPPQKLLNCVRSQLIS